MKVLLDRCSSLETLDGREVKARSVAIDCLGFSLVLFCARHNQPLTLEGAVGSEGESQRP